MEESSVGRPQRMKRGRPHLLLPAPPPAGSAVLERSLGTTVGNWTVYFLLTVLFAHLIGPKPMARVTNRAMMGGRCSGSGGLISEGAVLARAALWARSPHTEQLSPAARPMVPGAFRRAHPSGPAQSQPLHPGLLAGA